MQHAPEVLAGVFLLAVSTVSAQSTGAVRFFGTGTGVQDRVLIRIDDSVSTPADVGGVGFTVDFWLRGTLANNTSSARAEGSYGDFN